MITHCKYCNRQSFYLQKRGTQTGLYCMYSDCNKWQKWVGSKDLKRLESARMPLFEEHEIPRLIEVQRTYAPVHEDALPDAFNQQVYNHQPFYPEPPIDNESQYDNTYIKPTNTSINTSSTSINANSTYINQHTDITSVEQLYKGTHTNTAVIDMCVTCVSGIVPTLGMDDTVILRLSKDEKLLSVTHKDTGRLLSAFRVNFCPTCGKPIE